MKNLIAAQRCSFGSGTRAKGFVFGSFEVNDGVKPYDFQKEIILPNPLSELKTGKAVPADGVSDREFATAFRNSHIVLQVEDGEETEQVDYKTLAVESSGLSAAIKSALETAGIKTLGELEEFGNEFEGFQTIDGIAEASETAIIEELKKHISN